MTSTASGRAASFRSRSQYAGRWKVFRPRFYCSDIVITFQVGSEGSAAVCRAHTMSLHYEYEAEEAEATTKGRNDPDPCIFRAKGGFSLCCSSSGFGTLFVAAADWLARSRLDTTAKMIVRSEMLPPTSFRTSTPRGKQSRNPREAPSGSVMGIADPLLFLNRGPGVRIPSSPPDSHSETGYLRMGKSLLLTKLIENRGK